MTMETISSKNIEVSKVKTVLKDTAAIVKRYKQVSEAKMEYYNMFSVLKIETRENNTHSAFISDLLNPKGAHRQGGVFLELFLEVIKPQLEQEDEEFNKKFPTQTFDTYNAYVKSEFSIGETNLGENDDDPSATGGRIDIFLRDRHGTIISIENKIHALDQKKQIQRYYNYKTNRNTVFYLTLDGSEPSEESKLNLISDKDFFNISYKNHITQWLELCLKEIPNFTALRETINQYIILIKKLTYTMNKEQQEELERVMLNHFEEANYIAQNYEKLVNRIRDKFRSDLMKILSEELDNDLYIVIKGSDISRKFAQIWIRFKNDPETDFLFGVESFSGKGNIDGNLFVGILDVSNSPIIEELEDENRISVFWKQVQPIRSNIGNNVNLSSAYWIKILSKPKEDEYKELLETSKSIIVDFIKKYEQKLPKHLVTKG